MGHAYLAHPSPRELQDVEVREQFRRRGVARSLVGAIEAAAIELKARALHLTVSATNEHVQALYRSLGLRGTGQPPVTVRVGSDQNGSLGSLPRLADVGEEIGGHAVSSVRH